MTAELGVSKSTPVATASGPITLVLTAEDQEAVHRLTVELSASPDARIDAASWVDRARDLSCQLPLGLREALRGFRREPGAEGLLLIQGLPTGAPNLPPTPNTPESVERTPTPSAAALVLTCMQLGDVTAFRKEKGGALVQNIVPVVGQEGIQGNSGSVALKMHIENGFHTHRPDYVALLCLRNDHDDIAGLRTASIRRALPLLSEKSRKILAEPRFVTNPPASFGDFTAVTEPRPVLEGDPQDPDFQIDFACTEPQGAEAKAAMDELAQVFDHVEHTSILRPGDLAIVDNRLTTHGRTTFRPRYDGHDRWLQRTSVHLDPRRTRPMRPHDCDVLS